MSSLLPSIFSSVTSLDGFATVLSQLQTQRDGIANSALSRGAQRIQEQKYDEAIAEFKRALAYSPTLAGAYTLMGRTYELMGRKDDAIEAYKRAVRLDPGSTDAKTDLGNAYVQAERYAEAEKQFKEIARTNPSSPGPTTSLGYIYLSTDRPGEAETQFLLTVRLAPKDATAHYSLGLAYEAQGRHEEAAKQFETAVSLNRDYAAAYADLAHSYIALGRTAQARQQLDELWRINTTESLSLAGQVQNDLYTPKILIADSLASTFPTSFGPGTPVASLDPSLATPGASKTFTMVFQFNRTMDIASVQNVFNWSISQATGGAGGLYNNGVPLQSEKEVQISPFPLAVSYDPVKNQATVIFAVSQNATGDGVMDPSHWVFKFSGKDANGTPMDPKGDEYSGFAILPF